MIKPIVRIAIAMFAMRCARLSSMLLYRLNWALGVQKDLRKLLDIQIERVHSLTALKAKREPIDWNMENNRLKT